MNLVALAASGLALLMHEGTSVKLCAMNARLVVLNKTGNLAGNTATRTLKRAKFKACPNPVQESISLEIAQNGAFSLFDLNGKIFRSSGHALGKSSTDVRDLPNDFYLMGFRSDGGIRHFEKTSSANQTFRLRPSGEVGILISSQVNRDLLPALTSCH